MTTVILATQRTGSTLLCSEFEEIGGLGRPGEHFLPWLRAHGESEQLSEDALAKILAAGRGADGRCGLKLMADYLPRIGSAFGISSGTPLEVTLGALCRLEDMLGPIAWYRLDREDVFDQALSSYLATATGVFFRTTDGTVTDKSHQQALSHQAVLDAFDGRLFDTYVAQVERDKAFLGEICDALDRPVLSLTYERLCADREGVLARCCRHAGIEPPTTLPKRWMRKVVDDRMRTQFRERAEGFWAQRAEQGHTVPAIARMPDVSRVF